MVTICATLVNIQTHWRTHTETAFWGGARRIMIVLDSGYSRPTLSCCAVVSDAQKSRLKNKDERNWTRPKSDVSPCVDLSCVCCHFNNRRPISRKCVYLVTLVMIILFRCFELDPMTLKHERDLDILKSSDLLHSLHWLPVRRRIEFKTAPHSVSKQ